MNCPFQHQEDCPAQTKEALSTLSRPTRASNRLERWRIEQPGSFLVYSRLLLSFASAPEMWPYVAFSVVVRMVTCLPKVCQTRSRTWTQVQFKSIYLQRHHGSRLGLSTHATAVPWLSQACTSSPFFRAAACFQPQRLLDGTSVVLIWVLAFGSSAEFGHAGRLAERHRKNIGDSFAFQGCHRRDQSRRRRRVCLLLPVRAVRHSLSLGPDKEIQHPRHCAAGHVRRARD